MHDYKPVKLIWCIDNIMFVPLDISKWAKIRKKCHLFGTQSFFQSIDFSLLFNHPITYTHIIHYLHYFSIFSSLCNIHLIDHRYVFKLKIATTALILLFIITISYCLIWLLIFPDHPDSGFYGSDTNFSQPVKMLGCK